MHIVVERRDWKRRDDLATAFESRYGRRPSCSMKDVLLRLFDDADQEIGCATESYTVELRFPVEDLVFEVTEYLTVRLRLAENGALELRDGVTEHIFLDGRRLTAGSRFVDAEIAILDALARRAQKVSV